MDKDCHFIREIVHIIDPHNPIDLYVKKSVVTQSLQTPAKPSTEPSMNPPTKTPTKPATTTGSQTITRSTIDDKSPRKTPAMDGKVPRKMVR